MLNIFVLFTVNYSLCESLYACLYLKRRGSPVVRPNAFQAEGRELIPCEI